MRAGDRKRIALLAQFGNRCQRCGYDRCPQALQFHHVDDSEKRAWSKTGHASKAEVAAHPERFHLLCANCHFELHAAADAAAKLHATCAACGTDFTTELARLADGRGIYCSRKCANVGRRRRASTSGIVERFWKYVEKTPTCWRWTAYTESGTPILNVTTEDGKHTPMSATRLSYALHHGEPPREKQVWRHCGTAGCLNPEHLYLR
jgi:hypothetical protein